MPTGNKDTEVSGTKPEEQPAAKRRPFKTLRIGDCSASIWSRDIEVQGETRTVYSISLNQSYVARDGKRKYSDFLNPDALGSMILLCIQSSEVIRDRRQEAEPTSHQEEHPLE